jgi:hypothetical protein
VKVGDELAPSAGYFLVGAGVHVSQASTANAAEGERAEKLRCLRFPSARLTELVTHEHFGSRRLLLISINSFLFPHDPHYKCRNFFLFPFLLAEVEMESLKIV